MEGYSVTEAASILGVPTERVWELLARGVLAGAAEGETGMRVYLQPRPAPAPPAEETARPNGHRGGSEPDRELSPFRELLTEFRNLTERYGQALLALGEARGEVAALRSRVDLLEARMDLRLPLGATTPTAPWPEPAPPPPAADREAAPDDEERRSRRRRSGRHATESFAEALARAEDPTRPELPGAADAAAALAALRAESVPRAAPEAAATPSDASGEVALPRELPAAEAMPLPDEPDASRAEEPPRPADEAPPQPSEAEAEAEVAVPPPPAEPAEAMADEPAPGPIGWDPERYSAAIEEPDWYVDAEPAAGEPDVDAAASGASPDVPETADAQEPDRQPDAGADEMEMAGGTRPRPAEPALSGSRELDEALAALDALAGRTDATTVTDAPAGPAPEAEPPPTWPAVDRPPPTPPPAPQSSPRSPAHSSGVELQRLPSTPASRAYRRLRRIFPG